MKKSEKRLLLMLLSLALLGAVVVCSDIYFDKKELLEQEHANLENEWIEIQTLFEERTMWELRGKWLSNNQPTYIDNRTITQEIFDIVEKPGISGVSTSRLSLIPLNQTPNYTEVGVSFSAEGELERILRWLYDISSPTSFRVIRDLELTPGAEDPRVLTAKIELVRWYAPPQS